MHENLEFRRTEEISGVVEDTLTSEEKTLTGRCLQCIPRDVANVLGSAMGILQTVEQLVDSVQDLPDHLTQIEANVLPMVNFTVQNEFVGAYRCSPKSHLLTK